MPLVLLVRRKDDLTTSLARCHNIQTKTLFGRLILSITTVSSREFSRDLAQAKRAATAGPVFVTDRGKPTFALLKIEDYYRLAGEKPRSLLDIMDALPGGSDIEFDPPKLDTMGFKPAELI